MIFVGMNWFSLFVIFLCCCWCCYCVFVLCSVDVFWMLVVVDRSD